MVQFLRKTAIAGLLCSSLFAGASMPAVTAQAWLVADEQGNVLSGYHTTDIRSIASITKLMTSMVVLDSGQPLDEVIPKKLYNKNLTRQELIDLAIVKSDNNAANLLCESYPSGYKECINAMNSKATSLGMYNTSFSDSTGLLHANVSTAEDLIKLVQAASNYQKIVEASSKDVVTVNVKKNKQLRFYNTNTLVGKGANFIVSKTGFISKSGGCIVFMIETVRGIRTVVLLGSKNTRTRIPEAYMISSLY